MLAAALAVLGAVGGAAGIIAVAATFLRKEGAGQKADAAIQNLPQIHLHTAHATFNEAADAVIGDVETAIKAAAANKPDAFLAFMETRPSPVGIVAWLEGNVGMPFLAALGAQIPTMLQQGLTILGHGLPTVLTNLVGQVAPAVATQMQAAKAPEFTSAQIAAGLAALSAKPAAA